MKDDQILDSWKEISEYLGRSRKTCLRWEKEFGLPIHRLDGTPKARVFAYRDELDRWLEETLKGKESPQKLFPSFFIKLTSSAKSMKSIIPALIVALAIISAAIWKLIPHEQSVTAPMIENSIAVISFENQTGDPAYNYLQNVIPNLMITDLEQSNSLYVLTWERMHDLINQIGKQDVNVIDLDLGLEICRREGIQSIIRGTYSKAGNTFVSDVKILDVETRESRKSHRTKGVGESSILTSQVDELSDAVLGGMGIFEPGGQGSMKRVADVTTSSMTAYDLYLKGREAHRKYFFKEAITYFDRAIELDPSFAMAYYYLARSCAIQKDFEARDGAILKAIEYSKKATEKERLTIEAECALFIERNEEKWLSFKQRLVKKYPREVGVFKDLGVYYQRKNDEENAIEMYNKSLELDPNNGETHNALGILYLNIKNCNFEKAHYHFKMYATINPHEANPLDSLAHGNFYLGRVDEALLNFKAALEIKPDFELSMRGISFLYAFKENYEEAMDSVAKYMAAHATVKAKYEGLMWKGFFCSWLGRYDEGLDYLTQSQQFAESDGNTIIKCGIDFIKAQIYREIGQTESSRKLNENWYQVFINEYPNSEFFYKSRYAWLQAMLDLQERDVNSAKSRLIEGKSIISEISKPRWKEWAIYFYNLLEGEILMAEELYGKAISLFENEKPVVSPSIESVHMTVAHNFPFTRDVLAQAYIENGKLDKAIQEYERLTSYNRMSVHQRLIHPLYYYRLALLYEQKGWKGKAIENYEKFLELWKNADPGRAEVEDARIRLTRLK